MCLAQVLSITAFPGPTPELHCGFLKSLGLGRWSGPPRHFPLSPSQTSPLLLVADHLPLQLGFHGSVPSPLRLARLTDNQAICRINTDFDLRDIVPKTNELQDWMLEEEDRASIELVERAGFEEEEEEEEEEGEEPPEPRLEPFTVQTNVTLAAPPPPSTSGNPTRSAGQDPSRQTRRRKRMRGENPPQGSKSERLEGERVKRARKDAVRTDAQLKTLRPGLKLPAGCEKKVYTADELTGKGFHLWKWDGL